MQFKKSNFLLLSLFFLSFNFVYAQDIPTPIADQKFAKAKKEDHYGGDNRVAMQAYEEALKIYDEKLGQDSDKSYQVLGHLTLLYKHAGAKPEKARPQLIRFLKMAQKQGESKIDDQIKAHTNLAALEKYMKNIDAAINNYEKAFELSKQKYKRDMIIYSRPLAKLYKENKNSCRQALPYAKVEYDYVIKSNVKLKSFPAFRKSVEIYAECLGQLAKKKEQETVLNEIKIRSQ